MGPQATQNPLNYNMISKSEEGDWKVIVEHAALWR
jgi:hypothetical protein